MKIAMGCDHGGYELKEIVKAHLLEKGYEVDDKGCYSLDSVDYPEYAKAVGEDVVSGKADKGIVLCTTGIGISIAANKVKGVRAALCSNTMTARMTREHNDANVLALSGGMTGPLLALEIVDVFLDTKFSNMEKHVRRIEKVAKLEG
ncbi:MAG: ribose 5-phosphate isomerase B [Lachnospiraceae bacterium]|nr:ribose 5-phosphate isomerase B [Lachnospiraceae bacterium]